MNIVLEDYKLPAEPVVQQFYPGARWVKSMFTDGVEIFERITNQFNCIDNGNESSINIMERIKYWCNDKIHIVYERYSLFRTDNLNYSFLDEDTYNIYDLDNKLVESNKIY